MPSACSAALTWLALPVKTSSALPEPATAAPCADWAVSTPPSSAVSVTVTGVEATTPLISSPAKTSGAAAPPVSITDSVAGSPGCCGAAVAARL